MTAQFFMPWRHYRAQSRAGKVGRSGVAASLAGGFTLSYSLSTGCPHEPATRRGALGTGHPRANHPAWRSRYGNKADGDDLGRAGHNARWGDDDHGQAAGVRSRVAVQQQGQASRLIRRPRKTRHGNGRQAGRKTTARNTPGPGVSAAAFVILHAGPVHRHIRFAGLRGRALASSRLRAAASFYPLLS
jgi:hypothetical protein